MFRFRGRLTLLVVLLCAYPGHAQQQPMRVLVQDPAGLPIRGAIIRDPSGSILGSTGKDGVFTLPHSEASLRIEAAGFVTATVNEQQEPALRVTLARRQESVTVTAYRTPLAAMDSPASTRILTQSQLQQGAAPALDGKLRQVPGVELFRRTSSLISNPTSQGISLRGLGSTAASRTLVVSDDVPLNDPFGGWIHWEELPELSIRSAEVVRGGASDLYGSSAIGGVVSLNPVEPTGDSFIISSSHGGDNTNDDALFGSLVRGAWSGLATGGILGTDGYTLVAPNLRGPIDTPYNDHAENGLVLLQRRIRDNGRIYLRGNGFNEARDNGTPIQKNATRLWRFSSGVDWEDFVLRLYGSSEHYRQTFSAIAPGRASEKLTRFAQDPATELGAQLHWRHAMGEHMLALAGADTHDVRGSDNGLLVSAGGIRLDTTARQRQTGFYGEVLLTPARWTLSGSARIDHFSNFDAAQYKNAVRTVEPATSETVFNPRLGITRRITKDFALNASAFRAFRAPTINELYRQGQINQQITLANPNLRSERATGWETGGVLNLERWNSTVRGSYFWTQVNRPITALTLSVTPTETLLQRANLGQFESRGVSIDFESAPRSWLSLDGGYQYADATVTKFQQQPALVGKWIPQVARNMATTQVRFSNPRLGLLSLQGRLSGRQFDDDRNFYLLHGYFRLDVYASRQFGRHAEFFASAENLFDRAIEVGRTPILTLGTPRLARFGVRLHWN